MDTKITLPKRTNNLNDVPSSQPPQKMTPQKLEEGREKCICFNCGIKYSKGNKCGENKLFYIDYEEEEPKEQEPPQGDKLEVISPTISCHAFVGISNSQNIKIKGYIKTKIVNSVD